MFLVKIMWLGTYLQSNKVKDGCNRGQLKLVKCYDIFSEIDVSQYNVRNDLGFYPHAGTT